MSNPSVIYNTTTKELGDELIKIYKSGNYQEFLDKVNSLNDYTLFDLANRYAYDQYGINPTGRMQKETESFTLWNNLNQVIRELQKSDKGNYLL